ncbi:MAG TPA: rhodanese-like domain-containing protein [Spirochaetia bacterium]|nr:rhodanese-like domain-containing protein [Spirochaetia bacterium]
MMRLARGFGLALVLGMVLLPCRLFAEGAPDYKDPAQLLLLISNRTEPYVLVDVRTAAEYEKGHMPTAVNIPYDTIGANPPTTEKSALIIVYCASGVRSARASKTLTGLGYGRVVDFGAFSRWQGPSLNGSDPGDCPCRVPQD